MKDEGIIQCPNCIGTGLICVATHLRIQIKDSKRRVQHLTICPRCQGHGEILKDDK